MKHRQALLLLLGHLLPVAAWAAVKPLRSVAPELLGLQCSPDQICVDDERRLPEARALLLSSRQFVHAKVGNIRKMPRAIFCSTQQCSESFGLGRSAAFSVGTVSIIISDRAWEEHFVRHELIHHLQNERMGVLNAWLFKPSWFIEGMAYARSEDPRHPLPQPLEAWRADYLRWESSHVKGNLWAAAEQVR